MKPTKHLSAFSKKLASVPELPYKKGLINASSKPKEKHGAKSIHAKMEPMVLRSPPTGESIIRFALPIPSSKTRELLQENEIIRKVTRNLKMIASSMEESYGIPDEFGEEKTAVKTDKEGVSLSVASDFKSFLLCCTEFTAQLHEAVKEERHILESLFKWFQQQVNQVEEISKGQAVQEADLPSADKSNLSFAQIVNVINKLEELKNRLKERKASIQFKHVDKEAPSAVVKSYEVVEKQIEEFIKSHSIEEPAVVSETETAPEQPDGSAETTTTVTDRWNMMMKIFENQTTLLEKALNDQGLIEAKYKQIQTDFEQLSLEKSVLELEIQKMKEAEKTKPLIKEEQRPKKTVKLEKKKDKDAERKVSPSRELKTLEEFLQIQREADALKIEKKALQEQLRWALQEAERNKTQLDYVLRQELQFYKSEEKIKARLDKSMSRLGVTGDDSRHTLTRERESRTAFASRSGGQRTSEHDQILSAQDERFFDERLERKRSSSVASDISQIFRYQDASAVSESSYGVPGVVAYPSMSELYKSFTAIPFTEEHRDSPSMEMLPHEKADASERTQIPEIQSDSDIENLEAPYEVLYEDLTTNNKDLPPESQVNTEKQVVTRKDRRRALFITAKSPDNLTLISRTHSEIANLEATKYEGVYALDEEVNENPEAEYEEKTLKAKHPPKKQGKILTTPDAEIVEDLTPETQGTVSKADFQAKKQRLPKRERPTVSYDVSDKNTEHQDSELKFEVQAKKLKIIRHQTPHEEVSDRNLRMEDQHAQSSNQVQLKKQKSFGGDIFTIHFAAPDESHTQLPHDSVSESQMQAEKEVIYEDSRLSTVPLEYQKKDTAVENLRLEKKLLITRSQSNIKKLQSFRDDNIDTKMTHELQRKKRNL